MRIAQIAPLHGDRSIAVRGIASLPLKTWNWSKPRIEVTLIADALMANPEFRLVAKSEVRTALGLN